MLLSKDCKGIFFSTDLLLTLLLLVLVTGIMANIIDSSNEIIINPLEVGELERLTNEVLDSLVNNPGTPSHWEDLFDFSDVIPGLAIENNIYKPIINTISYKKLNIIKNNYNDLIDNKMFNGRVKSSMGLYPIDSNISPIVIGDSSLINESIFHSNINFSNIVAINRLVKCDFYSNFVITAIDGIKESEISGNNENQLLDYRNKNICNHESTGNLTHSGSENYKWLCKEFKITRKNFEKNNYYLIFSEKSINSGHYWILDNFLSISTSENTINSEKISLNNYLDNVMENKSSMIFYIHYKINKNKLNDFDTVLIEVPKDMEINSLNIDYFKEQSCNLIMRTYYV